MTNWQELTRPVKRTPGDWIPYGRAPRELIPEVEYEGPIDAFLFRGPADSSWAGDGEALRRWHKLRKAGLR